MRLRVVGGFCLLGTIAASGCFAFDWGYQGTTSGGGGGASSSAGGSTSTSNPTTEGGGGGGGSHVPVTTVFFSEGSRLEAHYYDYGGGVKDLIDWYDTKLKVNCTFTTFSDGNAACIPRVFDATTYFADPSCSQQLITYGGSSLCPGSKDGVVNDPMPTCNPPTTSGMPSVNLPGTVHQAGDIYGGGGVYFRNGTNTCTLANVSGAFRYRGDAIERTTFVTATFEDEPRGGGLTQKFFRGSDGSSQISRVYDANGPCNLRAVNGVEICLSVYGGFAEDSLFSDMCQTATIGNFSNVALCKPPSYIRYQKAAACLPMTQFFSAGAVVTPSPSFYYLSGTTCTLDPTTNENVLTQGDEIPLSSFPQATVETIGDGRVKETFFGTGQSEPLGLPSAHLDSAAGNASCSIYRFDGDKVIRCVDNTAVAMTYFKDASCTEAAGFSYKNSCAPVVTPKYGIVYSPHSDPCDPVSHASKLVTVTKSDRAAFSLNQGNCTAVDTTNIDSVYVVDGDYPISKLSVVEEVTP